MSSQRWWWIVVCVIPALICVQQPAAGQDQDGSPKQGQAAGGPPPALVRVGVVEQEQLQSRLDVVGRLRETRRSIVAAEQSGRVIEMTVEEGDAVTGDRSVLAQIDPVWTGLSLAEAQAQLQQTKAGVEEAQALLNKARSDHTYLEELLKAASAKPKEVEDAAAMEQAQQARLNRARADVVWAQAQLNRRQEEVARLKVVAPFDGVVIKKMTEVGQWVNQGDPVAEVIGRGQIDAEVDVPERLINHVQVGQEIEVTIEPLKQDEKGQVTAVTPLASTAARTFPVKIRMADQDGRLKAGMTVVARIPTTEQQQVLTVPRDAVLRSATGPVVWANLDGVAMPMPIKVLFGEGQRYAVQPQPGGSGPALAEGMEVVIEGGERLFPGQPLNVAKPVEEAKRAPNPSTGLGS